MKTARNFSKVIFAGQFPPPINGLTFITSRLASALEKVGYDVAAINTTGPAGRRSIRFHATRIARISRVLFSITSHAILGKSQICYFTAEGGLGLIYSVMIAMCARLFRFRIYIHHHSYSYIVRRRTLMKILLVWSGAKAVHICLSSGMAQDLANCYGCGFNSLVLSNAAFVDLPSVASPSLQHNGITIGLLSNLTADKGLYEFIEIVRIAKQRALPIRGVLAGPIAKDADKTTVELLKEELGEYLDYRGPVYEGEKARFFKNIDVFVFLTSYLNEAQPTVLFEAMAHGIPVISYDRGCIRSQVAEGGHVFSQTADIVSETLGVLDRYYRNRSFLGDQGQAALDHFNLEQSQSHEQIADLFEAEPTEVVAFVGRSQ